MSGNNYGDVVLSSRVRLARNFVDIPFPCAFNDVLAQEAISRTAEAIGKAPDAQSFSLTRLKDAEPNLGASLVERHLISPALLQNAQTAAVLINNDDTLSVMVGEEDHLRIQALYKGFEIDKAFSAAQKIDDEIESVYDFAFDPMLGYLTSCPTNAGTGMRASVMLHLPATTMARQMEHVANAVGRVGLTVRGYYGEGSEGSGCLYQLSNQITLGRSEQDIILSLKSAAQQVIDRERNLRGFIYKNNTIELEDKLMRSYGILSSARKMESNEFARLWSDLRLAINLGLYAYDLALIDELLTKMQPAQIEVSEGGPLAPTQRDIARADHIKRFLLDNKLEEVK